MKAAVAHMRREKDVHRRFSMVALSIVFMGCLLMLQSDLKSLSVGESEATVVPNVQTSTTQNVLPQPSSLSRTATTNSSPSNTGDVMITPSAVTNSTTKDLSTVDSQKREDLQIKTTKEGISSEGNATVVDISSQLPAKPSDDVSNTRFVSWEGWYQMQTIIHRFWKGNQFCEEVDRQKQSSKSETLNVPVVVNISFGCTELFQRSELGTGNYISLFYAMRLASYAYENVDFHFTCADAEDSKKDLILPWLTGYFPGRGASSGSDSKAIYANMTVGQVCGNYDQVPVAYMYKEIQHDLRRMAIGLVGIPSIDHPSAQFATEYTTKSSQLVPRNADTVSQQTHVISLNERPLYVAPEFERNDAVIHFRCGDLMASNHPSFGFMTFSGYVRHVSSEARSIGILTQPFEESANGRKEDSSWRTRDRCRLSVMSLVEYIQDRHPLATVHIHNNANETIALTYARMIMANQTIVGISSFGVFPAIASFGTGYIRRPDYPKAPNKWLADPPIDQVADNVVLFDEPQRIMARDIKRLWDSEGEEGVLKWFWNGEKRIDKNVSIS